MTVEKVEKRDAVLYAHVSKTNKKWAKEEAKKKGYTTLSEYMDALLTKLRKK